MGGAAVNEWLAANGYDSTRVNSRLRGRQAARARTGSGPTTPREIADLVVAIRDGRAMYRAASAETYRHLTRSYRTGEASPGCRRRRRRSESRAPPTGRVPRWCW